MIGTRQRLRVLVAIVAAVTTAMAVPLAATAPAAAASSGGSVYVWGINFSGQLGNGTLGSTVPVPLQDVDGIVFTDIDIGLGFDLGLTDGRAVYGWGLNRVGQLGRGTTSISERTPEPVHGPDGVTYTAVAAGYQHGMALATDGTVYTWGLNSSGQLGDDSSSDRHAPGPVAMPEGVHVAGLAGGRDASVAVADDGTVYTWGANSTGQLGNGTTEGPELVPAPATMPEGARFSAVSAGDQFAMALADDGTVYTWGVNSTGQLGNGTTGGLEPTPAPVVMPDGVRFTAVSAGRRFAMALADDGTVYTWGVNVWGQLGNGTTGSPNPTPGPIEMPPGVSFAAVDGGSHVGSALTPDGALYIWGRNTNRLFGDGTVAASIRPVPGQTAAPNGDTFGAMAMTSGSMSNAGVTGLPPDAVSPHGGGGQEVHVHEPFPEPLRAQVTTRTGDPVRDVPVTFTIHSPATFDDGGSSAVASTGAGGIATSPPLVATAETGPVEVTAAAAGIAQEATFTLTVLSEPASPSPGGLQPTPTTAGTGEPVTGAMLPNSGSHAGWLLTLGTVLAAAGALLRVLTRRSWTRRRRGRPPGPRSWLAGARVRGHRAGRAAANPRG